jgi:hypothetical protein
LKIDSYQNGMYEKHWCDELERGGGKDGSYGIEGLIIELVITAKEVVILFTNIG